MNSLCMYFVISLVVGRSAFTAFGRIATRRFLKTILFATSRLFKFEAVSCESRPMTHAVSSPGHHIQQTRRPPSTRLPSRILSSLTCSESHPQAFAVHPDHYSPFSSRSLAVSHSDSLSHSAPHTSLCIIQNGSECAGGMTSFRPHERLGAFHSLPQIVHHSCIDSEYSYNAKL
jgi:hypothetical protein